MSGPLLCLCPLKDVRRSVDWDNQEERHSRGQAGTQSNFTQRMDKRHRRQDTGISGTEFNKIPHQLLHHRNVILHYQVLREKFVRKYIEYQICNIINAKVQISKININILNYKTAWCSLWYSYLKSKSHPKNWWKKWWWWWCSWLWWWWRWKWRK